MFGRRIRRWWLIAALLIAAIAPGESIAAPGELSAAIDDQAQEAAWLDATRQLGAGDLAAARRGFEALAQSSPDGRWADDAMSEAAAIAERQGDLAAARGLWRQLLSVHPTSHLARRAQARLAALEAAGGIDGAWDAVAAEHARIERDVAAAEDPSPRLRDLGALLDTHREYPRWFGAALWLGESWARIGERELAMTWITRAIDVAREPATKFRAGLAQANLLTELGAFARADAAYRALVPPDSVAESAIAEGLASLRQSRTRARLFDGAWALLVACGLGGMWVIRRRRGSWRAVARALWPPPIETLFLAPVALVIGVIAETGNTIAARATQMVLIGGVVISWLAGVALATAPRSRTGIVVHVVVVAVAVVALSYVAVSRDQLLDLLVETWKRGHER